MSNGQKWSIPSQILSQNSTSIIHFAGSVSGYVRHINITTGFGLMLVVLNIAL
jgi:hypothetical protein